MQEVNTNFEKNCKRLMASMGKPPASNVGRIKFCIETNKNLHVVVFRIRVKSEFKVDYFEK